MQRELGNHEIGQRFIVTMCDLFSVTFSRCFVLLISRVLGSLKSSSVVRTCAWYTLCFFVVLRGRLLWKPIDYPWAERNCTSATSCHSFLLTCSCIHRVFFGACQLEVFARFCFPAPVIISFEAPGKPWDALFRQKCFRANTQSDKICPCFVKGDSFIMILKCCITACYCLSVRCWRHLFGICIRRSTHTVS